MPTLVEIDRSRLTQVLMNLIGNAIKFTPRNGVIDVKVNWKKNEQDISPPQINIYKTPSLATNMMKKIREYRRDSFPVLNNAQESQLFKRRKMTFQEPTEEEEGSPMLIPDENDTEEIKRISHVHSESTLVPNIRGSISRNISNKMNKYAFVTCLEKFPISGCISSNRSETVHERKSNVMDSDSQEGFTPNSQKNTESGIAKSLKMGDNITQPSKLYKPSTFAQRKEVPPILSFNHSIKRNKTLKRFDNYPSKLKDLARDFRMSSKNVTKKKSTTMLEESRSDKNLFALKSADLKIVCGQTHSQKASPITPTKPFIFQGPKSGILQIEVRDSGCGISPEEQKKLFQPFTQANNSVHSKFGGTGLGLWLCDKLISAMGGKITCHSILGKGTSFIIHLPTQYQISKKSLSNSTHSIYKDFQVIMRLKDENGLERSLTRVGCKVISCSSIEDIIEMLLENKKKRIKRQIVLTGYKDAAIVRERNFEENLGLKPSQMIVASNKLKANKDERYQYILGKPVNSFYLLELILHEIKGQTLCNEAVTPKMCPPQTLKLHSTNKLNEKKERTEILLVDDSVFCRAALQKMLKNYSASITECRDGIEALSEFKVNPGKYPLIIIDYNMPGMGGIDTIRSLREIEKSNQMHPSKILLLSGEEDCSEEGAAAGADFIEKKPLSQQLLKQIWGKIPKSGNNKAPRKLSHFSFESSCKY